MLLGIHLIFVGIISITKMLFSHVFTHVHIFSHMFTCIWDDDSQSPSTWIAPRWDVTMCVSNSKSSMARHRKLGGQQFQLVVAY